MSLGVVEEKRKVTGLHTTHTLESVIKLKSSRVLSLNLLMVFFLSDLHLSATIITSLLIYSSSNCYFLFILLIMYSFF